MKDSFGDGIKNKYRGYSDSELKIRLDIINKPNSFSQLLTIMISAFAVGIALLTGIYTTAMNKNSSGDAAIIQERFIRYSSNIIALMITVIVLFTVFYTAWYVSVIVRNWAILGVMRERETRNKYENKLDHEYKKADKNKVERNFWWWGPIVGLIVLIILDNYFQWRFLTTATTSKDGFHRFGFKINEFDFTIIAAILTIIGYSVRQKQQLVAEQIARSRIEWLKVTRKYVSQYMSSVNECWYLINEKKVDPSDELLTNKLKETENLYYKVIYSFNPKEEISIYLNKYLLLAKNQYKVSRYDKGNFTSAVGRLVQTYFKDEWDKAKSEIQNGFVIKDETKSNCSSLMDLLDYIDSNILDKSDDLELEFRLKNLPDEELNFILSYLRIMKSQKQLGYKKD